MIPWLATLNPATEAALIGGIFVSLGWIVNGWQNRKRDAAVRAERVRDVQRALYAEIRAYLAALRRDDIAAYGARIAQRIEQEPGYFPVIPTEHNDMVFRAIVADIHVLPRATVDPVVLYYSQLTVISAMIGDLRSVRVQRIGADRAAEMYRDYLSMKLEALVLGEDALTMMQAHLSGGANATARLGMLRRAEEERRLAALKPELLAYVEAESARPVSNPASARSDP